MTRADLSPDQLAFLERVALAMQHAVKQAPKPLLVSTGIAQVIDESDWGKAAPSNNYLGLKCPAAWTGPRVNFATHEVVNGQSEAANADFCAFDSLEACCDFYATHLCEVGAYASALALLDGADPLSDTVTYMNCAMLVWEAFTRKLAATYATNPNYGQDLVDLIRDYELLGYELPT